MVVDGSLAKIRPIANAAAAKAHSKNLRRNTGNAVPQPESEIVLKDNDVLCGHDNSNTPNQGNWRLGQMVQTFFPHYIRGTEQEKCLIVKGIIGIVRDRGGRFLERDRQGRLFDVGHEAAEALLSEALGGRIHPLVANDAASLAHSGEKRKPEDDVLEDTDAAMRTRVLKQPTKRNRSAAGTPECVVQAIRANTNRTVVVDRVGDTERWRNNTTSLPDDEAWLRDDDVLFDQGNSKNRGNLRFGKLIQEFYPFYRKGSIEEKHRLSMMMITMIRNRGGRFLGRNEGGRLVEIGDEVVEANLSQVLGERIRVCDADVADMLARSGNKKKLSCDMEETEAATNTPSPSGLKQ